MQLRAQLYRWSLTVTYSHQATRSEPVELNTILFGTIR